LPLLDRDWPLGRSIGRCSRRFFCDERLDQAPSPGIARGRVLEEELDHDGRHGGAPRRRTASLAGQDRGPCESHDELGDSSNREPAVRRIAVARNAPPGPPRAGACPTHRLWSDIDTRKEVPWSRAAPIAARRATAPTCWTTLSRCLRPPGRRRAAPAFSPSGERPRRDPSRRSWRSSRASCRAAARRPRARPEP